jgi:hypothetical protein
MSQSHNIINRPGTGTEGAIQAFGITSIETGGRERTDRHGHKHQVAPRAEGA